MSIEGTAKTEYASLSGKIHTFVVDKTLSISGACADAKATGEAIVSESSTVAKEAALEAVSEYAAEVAREVAIGSVGELVAEEVAKQMPIATEQIRAICT